MGRWTRRIWGSASWSGCKLPPWPWWSWTEKLQLHSDGIIQAITEPPSSAETSSSTTELSLKYTPQVLLFSSILLYTSHPLHLRVNNVLFTLKHLSDGLIYSPDEVGGPALLWQTWSSGGSCRIFCYVFMAAWKWKHAGTGSPQVRDVNTDNKPTAVNKTHLQPVCGSSSPNFI